MEDRPTLEPRHAVQQIARPARKADTGDLVRVTGRMRQSSYEAETRYTVDLLADGFAILAKAKVKTVEDDMQD